MFYVLDWNYWGEVVWWCFYYLGGGRGVCGDFLLYGRNGFFYLEIGVRCKFFYIYCRDINKFYIWYFVWFGLRKKNEVRYDFKFLSYGKVREKKLGFVGFCL